MTAPQDGGYIESPQQARERRMRALAQRMVNALGDRARDLPRDETLRQLAAAGLHPTDDQDAHDRAELVEAHIRWLLTPPGPTR